MRDRHFHSSNSCHLPIFPPFFSVPCTPACGAAAGRVHASSTLFLPLVIGAAQPYITADVSELFSNTCNISLQMTKRFVRANEVD